MRLLPLAPDAEITLLRHERGATTPAEWGRLADRVVFSLEEALQARPELAVVASPAPFHVELASCLAGHGIHLFLEKPVSDLRRRRPGTDRSVRAAGSRLVRGLRLAVRTFADCRP